MKTYDMLLIYNIPYYISNILTKCKIGSLELHTFVSTNSYFTFLMECLKMEIKMFQDNVCNLP